MNALRAVFIYEWKRSLTLGRMGLWLAMAAFPVMITILIRTLGDSEKHINNQSTEELSRNELPH